MHVFGRHGGDGPENSRVHMSGTVDYRKGLIESSELLFARYHHGKRFFRSVFTHALPVSDLSRSLVTSCLFLFRIIFVPECK